MSEAERDQRLDAAWRLASHEEPPPALDDAIRAAARHAVDAALGRGSNKHWWYPLAAAATVAVLAVGIARLTPPAQVAPTVGAETPGVQREARQDAELKSAALDAKPGDSPVAAPAAPPPPAANLPAKAADSVASPISTRDRPRSAAGDLKERAVAAEPALSPLEKLPGTGAAAARSQPFPVAPEAGSDAYAQERALAQSAPAGAAAGPRLQPSRMTTAKVAPGSEAKAQAAPALGVAEWIRRIRELKSEGRADEAAKELAAFHAAYGERADALLPADLQPSKR